MNKLIIFPGNSPRNKEWGSGVAEHFGPKFDAVYAQEYDHWTSGEAFIDFDAEMEKLRMSVAEDPADTRYYLFAKSIGTILSLMAIQQGIIAPQKGVFFGMPLKIVDEPGTFDWSALSSFAVPALAFHNEHDRTADYAFTAAKLAELNPGITLVTTPGDTHNYTEFTSYESKIKDFLSI